MKNWKFIAWCLAIAAWGVAITLLLGFALKLCGEEYKNTPATEDEPQAVLIAEETGRLPNDDLPALTRCYMTEEEIREDWENQKIEDAILADAVRIDGVKVTHYCAEKRPHICGNGDGITASGLEVVPNVTVAVDPRYIPLGADVLVDYGDGEIHYYKAADTGGAIKGDKHIDLCVATHAEALQLGVRTATVYWKDVK